MQYPTRIPRLFRRAGQSYIMFALMLPVLIGFVGLGLDYSYLFYRSVSVQGAAELAAISGANDLPGSATNARTSAQTFAAANGFPNGTNSTVVTVNTPYGGDSTKLEVIISYPQRTFFIRLLGFNTVNLRGRAVAGLPNTGRYAMFANYASDDEDEEDEDDCENTRAIDWSGAGSTVDWPVHSNGGIRIQGASNTFNGKVTYRCEFSMPGASNSMPNRSRNTVRQPIPEPFRSFTTNSFTCNWTRNGAVSGNRITDSAIPTGDFTIGNDGPWWVGDRATSRQLKDGVYCSKGRLILNSGATGNVTLFSLGQLSLSGATVDLTAYSNGVVFISTATGTAISISGANQRFDGSIYAPYGQVSLSGADNVMPNGSIVADTVNISGANLRFLNPTAIGGGSTGRSRMVE